MKVEARVAPCMGERLGDTMTPAGAAGGAGAGMVGADG